MCFKQIEKMNQSIFDSFMAIDHSQSAVNLIYAEKKYLVVTFFLYIHTNPE